MVKIALLDVNHWHYPLYSDALKRSDIAVAAISDRTFTVGDSAAKEHDATLYHDFRELLDKEDIDFAFVFGRHADMPEMCRSLIEAEIAFSVEKPGAARAADLYPLRDEALRRGLFTSVPFILRLTDLAGLLADSGAFEDQTRNHLSMRVIAGPPERYLKNGSSWVLDPDLSGGGGMINLGIHGIDFARLLTGASPVSAYAACTSNIYASPVEEYASAILRMSDGSIATIEGGYCYPYSRSQKREFNISFSTSNRYLVTTDSGVSIAARASSPTSPDIVEMDLDHDPLYSRYINETLRRFREGEKAIADLGDLSEAMTAVDGVYRSIRSGNVSPIETHS